MQSSGGKRTNNQFDIQTVICLKSKIDNRVSISNYLTNKTKRSDRLQCSGACGAIGAA